MKRAFRRTLAACFFSGFLLSAGPARAGAVVIGVAPPPLRTEVIVARPGPNHVWVPGYWRWSGHEYVWVGGVWRLPPHAHAVWVPGHYRTVHGGWAWVPGHWR
jgi:hypothetical protein